MLDRLCASYILYILVEVSLSPAPKPELKQCGNSALCELLHATEQIIDRKSSGSFEPIQSFVQLGNGFREELRNAVIKLRRRGRRR